MTKMINLAPAKRPSEPPYHIDCEGCLVNLARLFGPGDQPGPAYDAPMYELVEVRPPKPKK